MNIQADGQKDRKKDGPKDQRTKGQRNRQKLFQRVCGTGIQGWNNENNHKVEAELELKQDYANLALRFLPTQKY